MLCPVNADPGLPGLLVPSSQPWYIALFYLVPLPCPSVWKLSPDRNNYRNRLICFPYPRDHYLSWHKVQCLKNCPMSYILSGFLAVLGRRINLALVIPCWPEADVFKLRFEALSNQISEPETITATLIFMKSLGLERLDKELKSIP